MGPRSVFAIPWPSASATSTSEATPTMPRPWSTSRRLAPPIGARSWAARGRTTSTTSWPTPGSAGTSGCSGRRSFSVGVRVSRLGRKHFEMEYEVCATRRHPTAERRDHPGHVRLRRRRRPSRLPTRCGTAIEAFDGPFSTRGGNRDSAPGTGAGGDVGRGVRGGSAEEHRRASGIEGRQVPDESFRLTLQPGLHRLPGFWAGGPARHPRPRPGIVVRTAFGTGPDSRHLREHVGGRPRGDLGHGPTAEAHVHVSRGGGASIPLRHPGPPGSGDAALQGAHPELRAHGGRQQEVRRERGQGSPRSHEHPGDAPAGRQEGDREEPQEVQDEDGRAGLHPDAPARRPDGCPGGAVRLVLETRRPVQGERVDLHHGHLRGRSIWSRSPPGRRGTRRPRRRIFDQFDRYDQQVRCRGRSAPSTRRASSGTTPSPSATRRWS